MIWLTRLNHAAFVLNSDLIERIDVTPDTVITLSGGEIVRVLENAGEVIRRIIGFRRQILAPEPPEAADLSPEPAQAEPAEAGWGERE